MESEAETKPMSDPSDAQLRGGILSSDRPHNARPIFQRHPIHGSSHFLKRFILVLYVQVANLFFGINRLLMFSSDGNAYFWSGLPKSSSQSYQSGGVAERWRYRLTDELR